MSAVPGDTTVEVVKNLILYINKILSLMGGYDLQEAEDGQGGQGRFRQRQDDVTVDAPGAGTGKGIVGGADAFDTIYIYFFGGIPDFELDDIIHR